MLRRTSGLLAATPLTVSRFLQSPTAAPRTTSEIIAEHRAAGEDATDNLNRNFIQLHFGLMSYRVAKLGDEIRAIQANPASMFPSLRSWPLLLLQLFTAYYVCLVYGRRSFTKLVKPTDKKTKGDDSTKAPTH